MLHDHASVSLHIEAWTKWYFADDFFFQMHFQWKFLEYESDFIKVFSYRSNWQ